VTERVVEGRKDREQITSISSRLDTVVSFTRSESVSLDDVIVTRQQLPPLEGRLVGATHIMVSGGSLARLRTSTAACSSASPGKPAGSGSS
jgi:hypothetical protein